jgi:hypothetical protein
LIRARVVKKIWAVFDALREVLKSELAGQSLLAPEGLDRVKGQIAKGDRFQELPFVFMDFPQHFLPGEACTYRSFFWWGNGVVFALILEGPLLDLYKKRLLENYSLLSGKGLHLSMAPTPWEWRKGTPHTIQLTRANRTRILRVLGSRRFLKLERFLPPTSRTLHSKRLIAEGVATFRLVRPILCR